jgi:CRP-like cAMP-binding protein
MITDFLIKHVDFSQEELDIILSRFERQVVEKNKLFLREGEICKKVAFVESGTLILSQTLDSGEEHILDFFTSGSMISDYYSFLRNIPSDANIKALKESSLLVLDKKDMEFLYKTIPNYQILGRILAEESFIQLAENLKNASLPPIERYERLIERKPMIFDCFPQYMIASYLGIRPEWLSKIRAKK